MPVRAPGGDNAVIDALFAPWDVSGSPGCALAVAQDGVLVYSRGYGYANLDYDIPITPQTVFDVASVTKQFVAAGLNMLALEGKLSLDDDVRAWLPELPEYESPGHSPAHDPSHQRPARLPEPVSARRPRRLLPDLARSDPGDDVSAACARCLHPVSNTATATPPTCCWHRFSSAPVACRWEKWRRSASSSLWGWTAAECTTTLG